MDQTQQVTRVEIAQVLDRAFEAGPLGRAEVIEVARRRGAPDPLLHTLADLPENRLYHHLRDLWQHLPDLPIGA